MMWRHNHPDFERQTIAPHPTRNPQGYDIVSASWLYPERENLLTTCHPSTLQWSLSKLSWWYCRVSTSKTSIPTTPKGSNERIVWRRSLMLLLTFHGINIFWLQGDPVKPLFVERQLANTERFNVSVPESYIIHMRRNWQKLWVCS
eukprot:scaffold38423_cov51-Attheya_sp.AAC.2